MENDNLAQLANAPIDNDDDSAEVAAGEVMPETPVEQPKEEPKNSAPTQVAPQPLDTSHISGVGLMAFDERAFAQMQRLTKVFVDSGAFNRNMTAPRIIMLLQAGHELGMKPVEALNSLYIVNGKTSIYGSALTKRFRDFGYTLRFKDSPTECTVTATSKDGVEYTETLTLDMAEKSGWTKAGGSTKPGWLPGANLVLKLRYGALNLLAKTQLAEVLSGSVEGIAEIAEDAAFAQTQIAAPAPNTEPEKPKRTRKKAEPAPLTEEIEPAGDLGQGSEWKNPDEVDTASAQAVSNAEKMNAPVANGDRAATPEQAANYKKLTYEEPPAGWTYEQAVKWFRAEAINRIKK